MAGERVELISTSTAKQSGFTAYVDVYDPSGTRVAGFWPGNNVVLDLQETGKNLGDDLAEGKPTMPLIHVMREGSEDEKRLVRHAVEQGGKGDLEAVVAAIHRVGALDYTRSRAREDRRSPVPAVSRSAIRRRSGSSTRARS